MAQEGLWAGRRSRQENPSLFDSEGRGQCLVVLLSMMVDMFLITALKSRLGGRQRRFTSFSNEANSGSPVMRSALFLEAGAAAKQSAYSSQ